MVKWKFGKTSKSLKIPWKWLKANSNMLNLIVMFNFSVSDQKYPFWGNLVPKIKIINFSWNLVPSLMVLTFSVYDCKYPFWAKLIKIVSLRRNMVPTLIRICRIQRWCSLCLWTGISFLGKCSPKNQNFYLRLKFGS